MNIKKVVNGDCVELAETVELMGRRWNILEKLHQRKYYVTELAEELGKTTPGVSTDLKDLIKRGLVEFEQREGDRRKYCSLTARGKEIFSAILMATQPREKPKPEEKELASTEEIDFYLNKIDAPSNEEILKMAAEEFMILCGEYIVTHHKRVLPFLSEKLTDPKYEIVRLNLLHSLSRIIKDARDREDLSEIKLKFEEPLKELATNTALEQTSEGSALRLCAIQTLLDILGRENAFKELINLYTEGVRNESELTKSLMSTLVSRYPENRIEVRKALFEMLKDPREDVRRRAKDQIRELRKPISYKASKMERYTVVNQNRKVEV